MTTAQDDVVVEANGLAAGYTDTLVLEGVDVRFRRGQITCIVGGSGCGKSTLLRTLIGLLEPRAGQVRVLGEDLYALDEERRADLLSQVGFMFQYGALLGSITVAENLAIPLRAHTDLSDAVIAEIIAMKLGLVGLDGAGDKLPSELSGGMRKRAGFARAVVLDPPLVLCDEPSAGLDPETAANLDELLLRSRELLGVTMIVVTHEVASILTIADHVVMLADGHVHFDGALEAATSSDDPALSRFFGRETFPTSAGGRSLFEALASGGSP